MMTKAEYDAVFKLPFTEASGFFRRKLNIPTKEWTDLWQGEHAKGFMSAGAYNADLLADLRKITQKAIDGGMDIREFRKAFRPLVEKYGWELKGGGPGWRADLIFRTNISTAYAAGRWQQFEAAGIKYLRYVHADGVRYPRPRHLAMHGTVRPIGDAFWGVNYPPQGFRCHCRAEAVTQKEYDATPDKQKQLPSGWKDAADPGWAYNVGKEGQKKAEEVLRNKLESLPPDIAKVLKEQITIRRTITAVLGTNTGKTSAAFISEIDATIKTVPANILDALEKAGYTVQTGTTLVDARPDLKGLAPRGWKNATWENVEGVHNAEKKLITIGEHYVSLKTGKLVKNLRVAPTLRHELGHAADVAFGDVSKTIAFSNVYYQDAYKISKKDIGIRYLTQPGDAGRKEAFAEIFAELMGGGNRRDVMVLFPKTTEYIKAVLGL